MEDESDDEGTEVKLGAKDINSEDEIASDSSDDDDKSDADEDDDDSSVNGPVKKEESKSDEEKSEDVRPTSKHSRRTSDDISEGKTVFLKNVPFSVKNDELKRYMEQFGPVNYALVCIDHLTEHSRGTAFVKFKVRLPDLSSIESAEFVHGLPQLAISQVCDFIIGSHGRKKMFIECN